MATPRKTAAAKLAETPAPEVKTPKQKTEADLKREAYSSAQTLLRQENLPRFRELCVQEGKRLGIEYTFTPTAEEKAAALLKETLEKYPHLRDQLVGQQADSQPAPETVS